MDYRLLTDEEKGKLIEAFPAYAGQDLSRIHIAGAVDELGHVRGLVVMNLVPHCEPMWIQNGVAIDFRRLIRVLEEQMKISELWVFAPNDKIARMAVICGAEDTGWKVFRKELQCRH